MTRPVRKTPRLAVSCCSVTNAVPPSGRSFGGDGGGASPAALSAGEARGCAAVGGRLGSRWCRAWMMTRCRRLRFSGASLVFVSQSASSNVGGGEVAGRMPSVPVWVAKPYLLDDFGVYRGRLPVLTTGTRSGNTVTIAAAVSSDRRPVLSAR